jgi:hypothetical protein
MLKSTVEFVMLIMLQAIKRVILIGMVGGTCSPAIAGLQLPASVGVSGNRVITVLEGHLDVQEQDTRTIHHIRVPNALQRAIATSSDIIFPESQSLLIDGKEYLLLVINYPSSRASTGYCGAGNEGKLYALQIASKAAEVIFSQLVQSCLKNIELADGGVISPFSSVSWSNAPVGIRIAWMSDPTGQNVARVYKYSHGQFVEVPVGN